MHPSQAGLRCRKLHGFQGLPQLTAPRRPRSRESRRCRAALGSWRALRLSVWYRGLSAFATVTIRTSFDFSKTGIASAIARAAARLKSQATTAVLSLNGLARGPSGRTKVGLPVPKMNCLRIPLVVGLRDRHDHQVAKPPICPRTYPPTSRKHFSSILSRDTHALSAIDQMQPAGPRSFPTFVCLTRSQARDIHERT